MKRLVFLVVGVSLLTSSLPAALPPIPESPSTSLIAVLPASHLIHAVGRAGAAGWEADRRIHRAGVLAAGPEPSLSLPPGSYRASFRLRRGSYPAKGFLHDAEQVARLEVRDPVSGRAIMSRDIDVSELPFPNQYEDRWMEFSLPAGSARPVTISVYWYGEINVEVESISITRFHIASVDDLAARATRLEERVRSHHLENGFLISRKADGTPDEEGDATTYTGFYAAALAWHLSVRRDDQTVQDLENAAAALHAAVKGDAQRPILARFVDEDGVPFPESPSKDVYAAFFFGCAVSYPEIRDEALRSQMRNDVRRVATRLLNDGFLVRGGETTLASLAPHFTTDDIRRGISAVVADKKTAHAIMLDIRKATRFLPFQPLFPGMKELLRALDRRDQEGLFRMALPTADGVIALADRVVRLLREHGRRDLVGPSYNRAEPPALRLAGLLASSLRKLPPAVNGRRFRKPSDLRFLASNALIALHVIKTAAVITGDARFEEYYRKNLFKNDALLQTALDWHGVDDALSRITQGNAGAARQRRGYLALLALYNLYQLETDPAVKETYRTILVREAAAGRHDDNPLLAAVARACAAGDESVSVGKALTLYPDSPDGFGDTYWVTNGPEIAKKFGGGAAGGQSMEPLPVSLRPRDSFLWQRSVRRIVGDQEVAYSGADYVFLYWLARRHRLIENPS